MSIDKKYLPIIGFVVFAVILVIGALSIKKTKNIKEETTSSVFSQEVISSVKTAEETASSQPITIEVKQEEEEIYTLEDWALALENYPEDNEREVMTFEELEEWNTLEVKPVEIVDWSMEYIGNEEIYKELPIRLERYVAKKGLPIRKIEPFHTGKKIVNDYLIELFYKTDFVIQDVGNVYLFVTIDLYKNYPRISFNVAHSIEYGEIEE